MNLKIVELAENVQSYITKHNTVPASIKIDKVKYNYGKLLSIFSEGILNNDVKISKKVVGNAPSPNGDKINNDINKENYLIIVKTTKKFIRTQKRSPNWVLYKGYKIHPLVLVDAFSRIILFQHKNQRLPTTCKFNSGVIKTNKSSPVQSNDSVFNYFVKVFGNVSTIDEALSKVKGKGYGHYFNDFLSNKQVIDNLHSGNGQKPNCTDAVQVFYHIAKVLGYEVIIEHVLCTGSGEGHVRLKLRHSKHTEGNWIRRDPACVVSANGKPVNAIWCSDGRLLATNPSWIFESINR